MARRVGVTNEEHGRSTDLDPLPHDYDALPPGSLKQCPECGSRLILARSGRVICTNYGGCENAPG